MESKTKTKSNSKPKPVVHLEPGTCPGRQYFEKRDQNDKEMFTEIVTNALGDVPKHMRMAGDNRIWLWLLSLLVFIDTGMIFMVIIMISKLPK